MRETITEKRIPMTEDQGYTALDEMEAVREPDDEVTGLVIPSRKLA